MIIRPLRIATVLALLASVSSVSAVASADSLVSPRAPRLSAQTTSNARPSIVTGCGTEVKPPFFLTSAKKKLFSKGKITKCTVPPPQECKLRVVIEEKDSKNFGIWTQVPGGRTKGYTPKCLGLTVTTKGFKCKVTIEKHLFRTLEQLSVEYKGSIGTNVKDSTVIHEFC